MSSFYVVQISQEPITEDNRLIYEHIWNDPLYQERSDYDNNPIPFHEASEILSGEMKGFADIDREKRTLTFLDKETVAAEYLRRVNNAIRLFEENFDKGRYTTAEYYLRTGVRDIGIEEIFYDHYCKTTSAIITEYLAGNLPQTVYIGSVLSAHC